jgi:hypothetical protein
MDFRHHASAKVDKAAEDLMQDEITRLSSLCDAIVEEASQGSCEKGQSDDTRYVLVSRIAGVTSSTRFARIAKDSIMACRGSKPGERRGGREAGTPNRATVEVKVLAQKYGTEAIQEAVRIMRKAKSEAARLSAITLILDRAYGRVAQASHKGIEGQTIIFRVDEVDLAL